MKRIFIALSLPKAVKEEIKKIQEKLPEFIGKNTEFENLHLTVKFLGDVNNKQLEMILEKLKEIDLKKFPVEINGLGVFTESYIRIIWLHLNGAEELQRQIDKKLEAFFEKENRFMSHVTIARVKHILNKPVFLKELNKISFNKINFVVDKFYLMESILSSDGSEYEMLKEFSLK